MPELTDLLPEWAALCPDECSADGERPFGTDYLIELDGEFFILYGGPLDLDDCSHILGGVVYHAARRGLDLSLYSTARPFMIPTSAAVRVQVETCRPDPHAQWNSEGRPAEGDPGAALRALATSALSAYLSAVRASAPAGEGAG